MTELDKLEQYLKTSGREYERYDEDNYVATCAGVRNLNRHQIVVADADGEYLWDAICHYGSYGYEDGLLEVMGEALIGHGDVEGWLTAADVIQMIEKGSGAHGQK